MLRCAYRSVLREERFLVVVDLLRPSPVLAEQELGPGVPLPDVPTNRVDDVRWQPECKHTVVLSRDELGTALFVALLHRPIDDQERWHLTDSVARDGVHLATPKAEPGCEVEERIPSRVHLEYPIEESIPLWFGVPVGGNVGDAFSGHMWHRSKLSSFPHEPENSPHQLDAVVDGLRPAKRARCLRKRGKSTCSFLTSDTPGRGPTLSQSVS